MTFYQRTDGRQTPHIDRQSADDRPTVGRSVTLVYTILFTMHVSISFMKLNLSFILFWESFHWTLRKNIILFLCWIYRTIRMTF